MEAEPVSGPEVLSLATVARSLRALAGDVQDLACRVESTSTRLDCVEDRSSLFDEQSSWASFHIARLEHILVYQQERLDSLQQELVQLRLLVVRLASSLRRQRESLCALSHRIGEEEERTAVAEHDFIAFRSTWDSHARSLASLGLSSLD